MLKLPLAFFFFSYRSSLIFHPSTYRSESKKAGRYPFTSSLSPSKRTNLYHNTRHTSNTLISGLFSYSRSRYNRIPRARHFAALHWRQWPYRHSRHSTPARLVNLWLTRLNTSCFNFRFLSSTVVLLRPALYSSVSDSVRNCVTSTCGLFSPCAAAAYIYSEPASSAAHALQRQVKWSQTLVPPKRRLDFLKHQRRNEFASLFCFFIILCTSLSLVCGILLVIFLFIWTL